MAFLTMLPRTIIKGAHYINLFQGIYFCLASTQDLWYCHKRWEKTNKKSLYLSTSTEKKSHKVLLDVICSTHTC